MRSATILGRPPAVVGAFSEVKAIVVTRQEADNSMLPSVSDPQVTTMPARLIVPTTGNFHHDAQLALFPIAVMQGHRIAAWMRGWQACLDGQPLPGIANEDDGWMSAFHELTWLG